VALGQVFSESLVSPANLHSICFSTIIFTITRGWHNRPGVAVLQSQKVAGSIPDEVLGFFFSIFPNTSSLTMALGSTQPLSEMSTRNLPGGKGLPVRKFDNLTAICEPIG
jgi:hypothetical protein